METAPTPNSQTAFYANFSRWITRGLGVLVMSFFTLMIGLVLTNDDPILPTGWAVMGCLMGCMLSVCLAWRWERTGGCLVLGSAVALGACTLYATLSLGLGIEGIVITVAYPLPFVILGSLSLADSQQ